MSSKLDYLQQKKLNPTDELRELLSALEMQEPRLKSLGPTEARDLLRDLDRVNLLLIQLQEKQVDLTPERGRFNALQSQLRRQVKPILKALGGPSALADYRPAPPPPRERWWWYIHEDVANRQRQQLRQLMVGLIVALLLIGGLYLAFQTVLAPSPEAVARVEAENDSMLAFQDGDYQLALAEIEEGLAIVPDDPGLLILAGVFQELLGENQAATRSFEQAKAQVNDPSIFYTGRGQIYFRTQQFERTEQDAQTALDIDEKSEVAWLLLGQALEAQDRRFAAIQAYEQAGELALEKGNNEIVVLARMGMGRISGAAP